MGDEVEQVVYEVSVEGVDEAFGSLKNVHGAAAALRAQVDALKEEPLDVGGMVKSPEEEGKKEKKKPLLPRKELKAEEEAAVEEARKRWRKK
jgi:hypothetical protein